MTTPCTNCGTRARHGDRIGCCTGCGALFASQSAFDKHRKAFQCTDPAEAGLVVKHPKSDLAAVMWGLAGSWDRGGSITTYTPRRAAAGSPRRPA